MGSFDGSIQTILPIEDIELREGFQSPGNGGFNQLPLERFMGGPAPARERVGFFGS